MDAVVLPVSSEVGLTYVSDAMPGILRRRVGRGFAYRRSDGAPVTEADRARIRALGIPPAYTNVWICADPNGHLQATGIDARGRKQYRYHPLWQATRSETKFTQLAAFGTALPAIRRALARDLGAGVGDLAFTRAALVLLLDQTLIRIGDPGYTAANRTFGATTLLSRHLRVEEGVVRLRFAAKGGRKVEMSLRNRRLARIFNEIGDLPGRHLFTYLDEAGAVRRICSQDVNGWLAETAGAPVTAKTFRTWGGTLAAFEAALATEPGRKLTLRTLSEAAAARLHNTPTIARKSYIHPSVLALAEEHPDDLQNRLAALTPQPLPGLRGAEPALLSLLSGGS